MKNRLTCFIPFGTTADTQYTINELQNSGNVDKIYVVGNVDGELPVNCQHLTDTVLQQTATLKLIAEKAVTDYTLLYLKPLALKLGAYALERLLRVADDTGSALVYSDCFQIKDGVQQPHLVIDYQQGSLRDDFDFGSVLIYKTSALKEAIARMDVNYEHAALYDLRLKVSQNNSFMRLPEFLYTEMENDNRKTGEKIFDYVDPKNRAVQIEMEKACTQHLKDIDAWLKPEFDKIEFNECDFPVEASVIIPVYNREKTIEDAVRSAFKQKTSFKFNVIVVDNHSKDNTTNILKKLAAEDSRLIHLIPERTDLGIGGCWTAAAMSEHCGKFAIQLDSDDIYTDDNVIESIVKAFYEQNAAMVVGTYKLVNFKLEEIPPGIIDHKEWTPDNGRNNALRINGLGAPRAFYTPVVRSIKVPNVSYGEDYAVALAMSRNYQIGRIYTPLYFCRRWEDNSDAALDINKMNGHNTYKDRIRTIELLARINKNKNSK